MAHRVDGFLISVSKETNNYDHFQYIRKSNIPLVFYDRIVPGLKTDQVIIDDFEAACKATKHLTDIGRKRIAHFAAPQNLLIAKKRKEGYLKAISDAGIRTGEELIFKADNFEEARLTVIDIFKRNIEIDGVFAVNDLTAIGAMQTLLKRGVKVPEDVSVVGFSDGRLSGITDPTLTSVDQYGYEMGTMATEMLLNRIFSEKDYPCRKQILKANLIIRESSQPKKS